MDEAGLAERLMAKEDPEHALAIAEEVLAGIGMEVQRDPEHGALRAKRGSPGVVLSGHVDLVPVTDAWSQPAFGNRFDDGRLYGRGAVDMRGPVAAMLAALQRTDEDAAIVLTSDEETTMETVRAYVDEGMFSDADLVVVGEPTELEIAVAGKGLVWCRVQAKGSRGHASTPRGPSGRGPSAPERLVEAVSSLETRPFRIDHPYLGEATLAISGLESDPTPFNVLSGEAEARVDVRFPPPKTPSDVERSLRSRLGMPREGLELSFEKREPAFLGDEGRGKQAVEVLGMAGIETRLTGVDYVCEASHWQQVTDALILGPGSIERAHAPDEHIERAELEAGARAYEALIEAFGA